MLIVFKMTQNENESKNLRVIMKAKNKTYRHEYLSCLKKEKLLDLDVKKLHRSIVTNNTDNVQKLLIMGVNPNAADNLLRSPLHLAASRGYKEIISLLIKYGADPNARDIIGNTALHLAACTNNIEIVTMLLDAGTDITSLDSHGRNPLQLAQSKLKLIQNNRLEGMIELTQMRTQIKQVIDLMLSFLRRAVQKEDLAEKLAMQCMQMNLNDTTDAQLGDQVSSLLDAIQDMSLD